MRHGLFFTLALACTPAADAPAPTPGPTPAANSGCGERVAAMRRAIAHVPADAEVMPGQAHMQIPTSSRGQKFAADHAVWLLADGTFDFEQTTSAGLTELLPRLQAALARRVTSVPTTVILFADRRVPAATVRGLVEGLPPATKYVLARRPPRPRPASGPRLGRASPGSAEHPEG